MAFLGPFAMLVMGMLAAVFMSKVARETGRNPMLWGLFSMLVMVVCAVLFILAGPLLRSRGSAILLGWLFGGIVIQFLGQSALYLVLHSLEGKTSFFVDARLPVYLVDRSGEQFEPGELRFGKEGIEVHERDGSEPMTITYADIQAAEPDGEVVRVHWQAGSTNPEQLTFMIADEQLSPTARRAQVLSIVAKMTNLAQLTPST